MFGTILKKGSAVTNAIGSTTTTATAPMTIPAMAPVPSVDALSTASSSPAKYQVYTERGLNV